MIDLLEMQNRHNHLSLGRSAPKHGEIIARRRWGTIEGNQIIDETLAVGASQKRKPADAR
jgi:hypothetical protein